ncbi:hypothetical protein KGF54_005346 [Candida jiufengensis]|uniref:uncharacterized protein n=1 Tax=Candida jiufengensis TaxID=497108 RepID=UPI00222419E8|nr:uncharacterized protein KGF54_005346 [Candida jiufengensis]KAI5949869.1 hypothetical protein KGF54_005346 [Candida jiufengensis]
MAYDSHKQSQYYQQQFHPHQQSSQVSSPLRMQGLQEYPFNSNTGNLHQNTNTNTNINNNNQSNINSPVTPQHLRYNSNNNQSNQNIQQQQLRSNLRKNAFTHMKTPTPSAYEVPSSPNVNHLSHLSNQNHSDSSDSNPVLDSIVQDMESKPSANYIQQQKHQQQHQTQTQQAQQQQRQSQSYIQQQSNLESQPSHTPQQQQQQTNAESQSQQQQQSQQRAMSDEEQQLATKLKETYKNIVNYEEVVQKNCIEITIKINQLTTNSNPSLVYGNQIINQNLSSSLNSNSSLGSQSTRTSELSNDLWTVYHHNITLLDNYYDFLVTSLKPSSNRTQFKTGKNIVELYKIPRRMWVYGIVGFLEVLKNIMGIFPDHEICSCFISHCFNIISNLTDPILEMEGWWSEKLGDLSRMAIALYSSKFIDWKISAEYWYSTSMKTLYGHGKIYYHMCTVQQDNLDALVNISKSVTCRDPFVPTQHYLRLVVENICTQRNILSLLELPIIDFIKIHKVLLSIYNGRNSEGTSVENIHDAQLQYGIELVTRYGLTFGSDSNGYNFFTREMYTGNVDQQYKQQLQLQQQQQQPSATNTLEKMNFWFNKGSLFAISNINHLIGFGDAKNPFAKLFELPEALKERKDKKDRKRKSRSVSQSEEVVLSNLGAGGIDGQSVIAAHLHNYDWFYSLQFINKSVLELSMRILNHYLIGPKQASTGHVIVWLYFLISIGEASKKYVISQPMIYWLFKNLFPWESLINYLNSLLSFIKNSPKLCALYTQYLQLPYITWFCENEFLPEVWKCWGTLWFDFINEKNDYIDLEDAGVKNNNIFDLPICGTYPILNMSSDNYDQKSKNQLENDNDERIVRIILLARTIADNYDFGLIRTNNEFKFDKTLYTKSVVDPFAEEFLNDGRFQNNNFIQPISPENTTIEPNNALTSLQKDELWFGGLDSHLYEDENLELEDDIIDDEEEQDEDDEDEDDDEEDDDIPYEEEYESNAYSRHQQLQQQHHHQQQLQNHSNGNGEFYNDSFIGTPTDPLSLGTLNNDEIEGNFGDKIDSNITQITLDTNIWLKHCGRIFKCVRNGILKISIPLIVFQELRALRKSSEATIADAATRSVIIIRELYLTREITPLRFDGTIASDINETLEFENNSNWRSNVDETILHAVNEHDEIGKRFMKGLNLKLSPFTKNNNHVHNNFSNDYQNQLLLNHQFNSNQFDNHNNNSIQQQQLHNHQQLQQQPHNTLTNYLKNSSTNSSSDLLKKEPQILNSRMAKLFKYCILITDDRNMRLRAKTIGLTSFQSKWLFNQLETVFSDRCID